MKRRLLRGVKTERRGMTTLRVGQTAEELTPALLHQLANLISDSVQQNSSIGFLEQSTDEDFKKFWIEEFDGIHSGNRIILAIIDDEVAGSVIISPETKPTGLHRAEFRKFLVHSKHQRKGLGASLEQFACNFAKQLGLKLLVLDSATAYLTSGVYQKWGWIKVGEIPEYALNPDGSFVATIYFYKRL